MTNREAFDKYLHERINFYSDMAKKELIRQTLTVHSYYREELVRYASHYGVDVYDVERFSEWLNEDSGVQE